ncbi:MAG TPA: ABC transporter permease [Verrucomicrobiae bacterium]|nr:ABC transporter permease [Verrucomicrobiae bacterium]
MIYLIEAFQNLLANRLRSALALIGLVVGVAAVIAIQILGGATAGAMGGVLKVLSNNTFLISPNTQGGFDPKSTFKLADIAALTNLPGVKAAIPYSQTIQQVFIGHTKAQLNLAASGKDPEFYPEPLAAGRFFTDDEISSRARVCILSDAAVQKLDPEGSDLLGREVRAGHLRCTVVGVLQKSPSGSLNFNFEPDISIPYTTFVRTFLRGSRVNSAQILVANVDRIAQTEDTVKAYFSALSNGKYKYTTFDSRFFSNFIGPVFGVLTLIVGIIGAISLVVAGIGIMNVLLVSITERTREIGVRKAIGAKKSQVLVQFFLEASLLTFTGCAAGAAIGLFAGWWINVTYVIKISGIIVPVPWVSSVVLAVFFATLVTLAFGTYPAYRAARLDPIEALRYE